MQRKELTEQIGKLNLKIVKTYKNIIKGIQLELKELELEELKKKQEKRKMKKAPIEISKKYDDNNNEFYSQEKRFISNENSYLDYMRKNIVPYND